MEQRKNNASSFQPNILAWNFLIWLVKVYNEVKMLLRSTTESAFSYLGRSSEPPEAHVQEHRNKIGRDVFADSYQEVDLNH